MPIFSGDQGDDFCKFRKEMERGLRTNRVRRDDQASKLRENLRNHPRSLIPNSLENIDEAWKILQAIYGDPSRVMNARKAKITSMGSFPKNGKGVNPIKNQVEWLMNLEVTLQP